MDAQLEKVIEGLVEASPPIATRKGSFGVGSQSNKNTRPPQAPAFMSLAAGPPGEADGQQDRKQRQSMFISDKRGSKAENNFGMPRQRLYSEQVAYDSKKKPTFPKTGYQTGKYHQTLSSPS